MCWLCYLVLAFWASFVVNIIVLYLHIYFLKQFDILIYSLGYPWTHLLLPAPICPFSQVLRLQMCCIMPCFRFFPPFSRGWPQGLIHTRNTLYHWTTFLILELKIKNVLVLWCPVCFDHLHHLLPAPRYTSLPQQPDCVFFFFFLPSPFVLSMYS